MSVMWNVVKMETVASLNNCATEQKLNFVLTATVPLVCVVPIFEVNLVGSLCYNIQCTFIYSI